MILSPAAEDAARQQHITNAVENRSRAPRARRGHHRARVEAGRIARLVELTAAGKSVVAAEIQH